MVAARLAGFSGREVIKKFRKLGYEPIRQTGSHVRLKHNFDERNFPPLTIPLHKEIGIGLLERLIKDAKIDRRFSQALNNKYKKILTETVGIF